MLVDENKFLDAIYCLVKKLEEREKEIAELKIKIESLENDNMNMELELYNIHNS